jgi:predicted RNA polymerase sigma factor
VLSPDARVALTLRLLCGLTTREIARAYLASESAVAQRIVRAKRTLSAAHVPFMVPGRAELRERLTSVLEVVYLIFNEGYSASAGERLIRPELMEGAAARAHCGRASPARCGGPRARRADGAAGVPHVGADLACG